MSFQTTPQGENTHTLLLLRYNRGQVVCCCCFVFVVVVFDSTYEINRLKVNDITVTIILLLLFLLLLLLYTWRMLSSRVPHGTPGKEHTFMVLADMGLLSKRLEVFCCCCCCFFNDFFIQAIHFLCILIHFST